MTTGGHAARDGVGNRHPDGGAGESAYHVHGGPVVLDIGGDIGAMLVTLDPSILDSSTTGRELHLRSLHQPPINIHTGIWPRDVPGGRVVAAVFPELVEGGYWVLDETGTAVRRVEIRGGALTSIDLRT